MEFIYIKYGETRNHDFANINTYLNVNFETSFIPPKSAMFCGYMCAIVSIFNAYSHNWLGPLLYSICLFSFPSSIAKCDVSPSISWVVQGMHVLMSLAAECIKRVGHFYNTFL